MGVERGDNGVPAPLTGKVLSSGVSQVRNAGELMSREHESDVASEAAAEETSSTSGAAEDASRGGWSEDWLAVVLGLSVLIGVSLTVSVRMSEDVNNAGEATTSAVGESLIAPYVGKVPTWSGLVTEPADDEKQDSKAASAKPTIVEAAGKAAIPVGGIALLSIVVFGIGGCLKRESLGPFTIAFVGIFGLAVLANVMAAEEVIKHYGLSYALWALALGLIITNTIGLPAWLKPAVKTEFYIKTGLVLLGAEVLLPKLVALGLPGIFVAWVVTPIVLISTYWFGQKVLGIKSKSLNMVIAADMSVCGVSAAIATAASCKAKKEELSLAVAMSLLFTVVMMVVMPLIIQAVGMDPILGGAWMGGTIDSTGAVAAAGEFLKDKDQGDAALYVATTVKMIQNILIGVTALCVAVYWTTVVERGDAKASVGWGEIWKRFPKFVLGFVAASIVFSSIYSLVDHGSAIVQATTGVTKTLRGWWFALAFVSIGLESNFREFAKTLSGGKPLLLYLCGQTLNLCLTLGMAWLMFRVIFRDWVETALAN